MTTAEIEKRWHRELLGVIHAARELGYNPTRLVQMVASKGALATGHHLINDYDDVETSEGFKRFWEMHRLDLAVETRALKPEYRSLFSAAQMRTCRRRLSLYGWRQIPPWLPPAGT